MFDGVNNGNTVVVSFTITPVNDPPVANPDAYVVAEGAALNVVLAGVLANDTDAEGDTLATSLVSGPMSGSLILNADGSFIYTHNGSETTSDSFVYRADDGNGGTDTATVTMSRSRPV